jgi:hypothetical protein
LATQQSIKAYVDSQVGTVDTLAEILANGNTTGGNDILFGDNDKTIFGAGSDLQIYHDAGGDSYITESNASGQLRIQAGNIKIADADGNNFIYMTDLGTGGLVNLMHNGSTVLSTTITGVDITGTAVTDGVTVDGNLSVDGGTIKLDGNYPVGTGNVALGDTALDSLTSGGNNTAIGRDAMTANTSGGTNVALGGRSLEANTSASNNIAVGYGAMLVNTTGANNVGIGYNALLSNTTASNNTAVGYQSGLLVGDEIVATAIVSGVNYTIQTLGTTDFTLIGASSNTVGTTFTATGAGTGTGTASANANYNTFVGHQSGDVIVGGSKNSILGRFDGNQNTIDIRNSDNNIVLSDGDGNPRLAYVSANTELVINEQAADVDFRVESDSSPHALFVDAGNNVVGMGISNPSSYYSNDLVVQSGSEGGITLSSTNTTNSNYFMFADASSGNGRFAGYVQYDHNTDTMILATNTTPRLHLDSAEVTVNEQGQATDFRVESVNNVNMLFVDADLNQVRIGSGTNNAPSTYPFISYAGDTSGRSAFVHAAGDGGVVISGSAGGSQAALIMGNNWGTNGATFSEEWRILMNGTDDSLNFNYNANASTALTLSSSGVATFGGDLLVPEYIQHSGDSNTYFGFPGGDQFAIITAGQNRLKFVGSESVFNEDEEDKDFRVASTSYTNALFVDAGNNNVNVRDAVTTDPSNSMNIRGNIRLGADSATRGDTIRSAGGATSTYNGMVLMSNHINASDQANTSLPSWLVDIGGSWADGTNFPPSTNDSFTIARRAAGGSKYGSAKYLGINSTATVINEDNNDHDFQVKSASNSNALFVDAGASSGGDLLFGVSSRTGMYNGTGANGVAIEKLGDQGTALVVQSSTNSCMYLSNPSGNTNDNFIIFSDAGSSVGSISGTSSGTTYNTTSDRRLKDNIEPIANGTEKLMAMKPVTHTWKADPEADAVHGFIAQEMMDVVPEAVSGDPDGEEMMSMDYGRITPVLVAALQDAHKKIAALEERLAEMEA